jgi:hypothetical protein
LKTFDDIGVGVPEIYLPAVGTDLTKWAVIACDQFTSEPEYWRSVAQTVGDAPSTFNLVYPEVFLEDAGKAGRIQRIQATMRKYLADGLLEPRQGMLYVERQVGAMSRRGLMLCLDLERYDYNKGSTSLIRATEGTIVERLPPRMSIREGAELELPHILVLIDDPEETVIEPVAASVKDESALYDFELMLGSGRLMGRAIGQGSQDQVLSALRRLASPAVFRARYGVGADTPVLLFAMGDGNHSLATAKAVWDKMKARVGPDHPARYALVEIENVHDDGLEFSPIHRVLFGVKQDLISALTQHFGSAVTYSPVSAIEEITARVDSPRVNAHAIGLVLGDGPTRFGVIEVSQPKSNLAVGTAQDFLDMFMKQGGADKIDYVHGSQAVIKLGTQPGNAALYLPRMSKSSLFKTVILEGALPRKTFSMGEAREKRFYMEARKIS